MSKNTFWKLPEAQEQRGHGVCPSCTRNSYSQLTPSLMSQETLTWKINYSEARNEQSNATRSVEDESQ